MTALHLNHVMYLKESSKHLIMTPTRWQRGDPYIHRFSVMTRLQKMSTFWNTDPGSARIDLRMLVQWIHHMQKSTRTHPKQHPEIQEAAPSSLIVLGAQRVSVSSNVICQIQLSKIQPISPEVWPKPVPKGRKVFPVEFSKQMTTQKHTYSISVLSINPYTNTICPFWVKKETNTKWE